MDGLKLPKSPTSPQSPSPPFAGGLPVFAPEFSGPSTVSLQLQSVAQTILDISLQILGIESQKGEASQDLPAQHRHPEFLAALIFSVYSCDSQPPGSNHLPMGASFRVCDQADSMDPHQIFVDFVSPSIHSDAELYVVCREAIYRFTVADRNPDHLYPVFTSRSCLPAG